MGKTTLGVPSRVAVRSVPATGERHGVAVQPARMRSVAPGTAVAGVSPVRVPAQVPGLPVSSAPITATPITAASLDRLPLDGSAPASPVTTPTAAVSFLAGSTTPDSGTGMSFRTDVTGLPPRGAPV